MWNEARKRRKAQFSAASDKSYDFTKTKTFDNSNEKNKEANTNINNANKSHAFSVAAVGSE